MSGANNLVFGNLNFADVGNGAFRIAQPVSGITIQDSSANNVRRFIENASSSGTTDASISGLTVKNVSVENYSKGFMRLTFNSNNILVEDVYGDSNRQDGDNFYMGIHLQNTVHNVMIRRTTMKNCTQTLASSEYWNADGFVAERETYNIALEDTVSEGHTDGGYDLKSNGITLLRTSASDNKRNYRIWGSATLTDCTSNEPNKRGGSGSESHINFGDISNTTVNNCTFTGTQNRNNIIFDQNGEALVVVNGGGVTDNSYTLIEGDASKVTLNNFNTTGTTTSTTSTTGTPTTTTSTTSAPTTTSTSSTTAGTPTTSTTISTTTATTSTIGTPTTTTSTTSVPTTTSTTTGVTNPLLDSDNDGIPNILEISCSINTGFLSINAFAGGGTPPCDTDNDGVPDYLDLDSDNDLISDLIERGSSCPTVSNCIPANTDNDSIPDYREPNVNTVRTGGLAEVATAGLIFGLIIITATYIETRKTKIVPVLK